MATIAKMVVELSLEDSAFQRSIKNTRNSLDSWGSSLRSAGTKLSAGITAPVIAGATAFVNWASDLDQAMGKSDAVFGDASQSVIDWSKTTAQSFGFAQSDSLAMAATYGSLFKVMGMSNDVASDYSMSLIGLAADMSAFNDVSNERASEALMAGLSGEYMSLRSMGVFLNEAAVSQEALRIATAEGREEITEADKVQARYNLIMEQTAQQQGQAARESKGFASRMAQVRAQVKNLGAAIGAQLMPYALDLLDWVEDMVDWFSKLSPSAQRIIIMIAGIAAAIGPLLLVLGMLMPGLSALLAIIGFLVSPIGLVVLAIAALAAGLIYAYTHFEAFRNIVDTVASALKALWDSIASGEFLDKLQEISDDAMQWMQDTADGIISGVQSAWFAIASGVIGAIDRVRSIVSGIWDGISNGVGAAWDAIQSGIQLAWNAITSLDWKDFVPSLDWALWIGGKIADIAVWVWDKISGFFPSASVITGTIGDVATWIWEKISGYFPSSKLINGVLGNFNDWVWGKIGKYFPGMSLITGTIGSFKTWIWGKIYSYFPSLTLITDSIGDFTTWIWGKISGYFPSTSLIIGSIADFGAWLYEMLGSPKVSIPDFPGWQSLWDAFMGSGGNGPEQAPQEVQDANREHQRKNQEMDRRNFGINADALSGGGAFSAFASSIGAAMGAGGGIIDMLRQLRDDLATTQAAVVSFVGSAIGVMGGWATGIQTMVNTTADVLKNRSSGATAGAMSSFVAFVAGSIGVMGGWDGGVKNIVNSTMDTMKTRVSGATSSAKSSIVTFVADTIGVMGGWSGGFGNIVNGAMQSMVGSIRTNMQTATTIVSVQSGAWSVIVDGAAGPMGAAGLNAGAAAGFGVANGLAMAEGAVSDAAARLISIVDSTMRRVGEIRSPSKLTARIGGYIGEGLEEGMRDSMPGVERAAAALMGIPAMDELRFNPGAQAPIVNNYYALTPEDLQRVLEDSRDGGSFARQFGGELAMRGGLK